MASPLTSSFVSILLKVKTLPCTHFANMRFTTQLLTSEIGLTVAKWWSKSGRKKHNWRSQLSTMHRRSKTESPPVQEKRQVRLTECNNRTYSRLRETSCTKIHPTRNPTCLTERNSRLFRIQFPYKHELDWNKICGNASFVFGNLKIKIVRKFLQVMYVDFSKNDVQVVNFST